MFWNVKEFCVNIIICSSNNIVFIQGAISYGNEPLITDWRIANSNGVFNIFNSKSSLGNLSILENDNISIGNASQAGSLNIWRYWYYRGL